MPPFPAHDPALTSGEALFWFGRWRRAIGLAGVALCHDVAIALTLARARRRLGLAGLTAMLAAHVGLTFEIVFTGHGASMRKARHWFEAAPGISPMRNIAALRWREGSGAARNCGRGTYVNIRNLPDCPLASYLRHGSTNCLQMPSDRPECAASAYRRAGRSHARVRVLSGLHALPFDRALFGQAAG